MNERAAWILLAIALALPSCGCNLLKRRPALEPTPIVFQQSPTLEQLASAVNANTERVYTLQTRDARLLLPGLPAVSLEMAYEQPRRLRLRAGTGLTGQELDLGSNDELFWFWARQNPQPALFYARHDQFARSPNRSLVPIEPLWLIDAMGLPRFDPNHRHEGPTARTGGAMEIRTRFPTAEGENTKITLVHAQYAWVLEQQVYDVRGRLLASSKTSDHEFYPYAQVAMPRKVTIELPPAQLSFAVESQGYSLNVPLGDSAALFQLPQEQFPNAPLVDVAEPVPGPAATSAQPYGPPPPTYPTTSEAPRVRGLGPR